ncbi:aldehyde dehydrogenase family protein [Mycolicibacterium duvalii]|uniref:Aldehyde dehydrogenase domain-containing protein n=1 Tax=Mycolicibacterium duvalii TaxID=39688 RepID=A0A7I7JYQ0_9MYCO|nr:aldehyde dehydrogenase family protein [Mycolicibacterium duvalii]BBX17016.1 hypothetical protein MDUV_18760 [Mycolicibacterium duvalii]
MSGATLGIERPAVQLRIGAQRLSTGSDGIYQHIDPTTGRPDADVPLAAPAEVDQAVQVAHSAYLDWRRTKPGDRRRMLMRLADLVESYADEFGRLAAMDNGTPVGTTSAMSSTAGEWIRYYAGWAGKISSEVAAVCGSGRRGRNP